MNNTTSKLIAALEDLEDGELLSLYRDRNSWNGEFEFCATYYLDELVTDLGYLSREACKNGSDLCARVLEIAQSGATSEWDLVRFGSDGYGSLEAITEEDLAQEARDRNNLEDLASALEEDGLTSAFSELPDAIEAILKGWDEEESED